MTLSCKVPEATWTAGDFDALAMDIVWPTIECCDDDALAERPELLAAAVHALHEKTCKKFGICDLTVRPCVPLCECKQTLCVSDCEFKRLDLRDFTHYPIQGIEEVRIDGEVVPSGDYWLSQDQYLIPRRDGELWDCPEQDLNKALGVEGTWSVTIRVGQMPPPLVLLAAGDLACQLLKYCSNQPCDLPPNAVRVIRDGVTVDLETGMNALPIVKMALESYGNCDKRKKRSRMVAPADYMAHTTQLGAVTP